MPSTFRVWVYGEIASGRRPVVVDVIGAVLGVVVGDNDQGAGPSTAGSVEKL